MCAPIFNFYRMLTPDEKIDLLTIPARSAFNPYLTRHFYIFLFEMMKLIKASLGDNFYKVNKSNTINSKLNIVNNSNEDNLIISQIIICLKNAYEFCKDKNVSCFNKNKTNKNNNNINIDIAIVEDMFIYKDIILYTMNILVEMITQIAGKFKAIIHNFDIR